MVHTRDYMTCNLVRMLIVNSAIILAGGSGSRIESEIPKQFLTLSNKPIIEYSIDMFEKNTNIDEIILVCKKEYIESTLIQKLSNSYKIVTGGDTRTQSTIKGLLACNESTRNVLIHDSARPFISNKIINSCIKHLTENDASIPIISCKDSLLELKKNGIQYLNRDNIKLIQTPQGFNYEKILTALKNNTKNYSDDFSALLDFDNQAKYALFNGDHNNFKVTTNTDLALAKILSNEI